MSSLFSPIEVNGVAFRNRVVMPPMVTLKADGEARATDPYLEHYGSRARAGTALMIVEATAVSDAGRVWPGGLGAYDDEHVSGLARLAKAITDEGAVAGIQLVHGGPLRSLELGGERLGPSAVQPPDGTAAPRALTVAGIQATEQDFAEAAARAVAAGFGLVEAHGAHGYLLDSFLSAQSNRRQDAYGGSILGRMRMLVETCQRMKERIGPRALLCGRISLFNKQPGEVSVEDLHQLVQALAQAGVNVLHLSTDGAFKACFGSDKSIGQWVREMTDLPIIVAGGLGDPRAAERAILERHADFAAVGGAMMEDPDWTRHAAETLVS